MNIKEQIQELSGEIFENLGRLVKYDSQRADPLPGKPFGEGPAAVLEEALQIAQNLGFKTVNLDNYCGYAEMGEGPEIIGIAGHLDVVPAGDGWHTDPFTMTKVGDRYYGRGTTDDKGPVIACLYAMKLLRDSGVKPKKRIRLIMGCNEETGSRCMAHYNEVEEPLSCGFTPDGNFPCIYGEKGGMAMKAESKNTKILDIHGGFVSNAVCHQCTTVIPAGEVTREALEQALKETDLKSFSVTEEEGKLRIFAEGLAAHASTPLLGINAAGCTMEALQAAGFEDDFVKFYNDRIGTKCDGSGCGLKIEDAYGPLTFNNGIVSMKDGVITCTIDIRVPVTVQKEQLMEAVTPFLEHEGGKLTVLGIGNPLFYPRESPLVEALYGAYREVTGDTEHEPLVIGGGTYAKSLKNIIAFGPEMPDTDYRIHNADEFLIIPEYLQSIEIYLKAIENLLATGQIQDKNIENQG